jgi:hypothetical protein
MWTLVNNSYGIAMGQRPPIHTAKTRNQPPSAGGDELLVEPLRPRRGWTLSFPAGLAVMRSVRYRFGKLAAAFSG